MVAGRIAKNNLNSSGATARALSAAQAFDGAVTAQARHVPQAVTALPQAARVLQFSPPSVRDLRPLTLRIEPDYTISGALKESRSGFVIEPEMPSRPAGDAVINPTVFSDFSDAAGRASGLRGVDGAGVFAVDVPAGTRVALSDDTGRSFRAENSVKTDPNPVIAVSFKPLEASIANRKL